MTTNGNLRLDQALVARGLAATRARARDAILRGCVRVDGVVAGKAGTLVGAASAVAIDDPASRWASRGALKLLAALEAFGLEPSGRIGLDIGSSTGGFTDVLLARGARRVYAVDVGHGQLIDRLRNDARVVDLSGCDARSLTMAQVPDGISALVADTSFISLGKVLATPLSFAVPGCWLAALVKPQFELSPAAIGKGGLVKRPEDVEQAVLNVERWLAARPGWRVLGRIESPITGKDGNSEYLVAAVRDV